MLWYPEETEKSQTIEQEIKNVAIQVAKNQLKLTSYEVREIRPDDIPSPSTVDFFITVAAASAFRHVRRKVSSNSLVIIAGFYITDVPNNNGECGTPDNPCPILKHVDVYRGTNLEHRWPLKPISAFRNHAGVTEGYMIYYPDDVIDLWFYAQQTLTVDQESETWYKGLVIVPPGAISATEVVS